MSNICIILIFNTLSCKIVVEIVVKINYKINFILFIKQLVVDFCIFLYVSIHDQKCITSIEGSQLPCEWCYSTLYVCNTKLK